MIGKYEKNNYYSYSIKRAIYSGRRVKDIKDVYYHCHDQCFGSIRFIFLFVMVV